MLCQVIVLAWRIQMFDESRTFLNNWWVIPTKCGPVRYEQETCCVMSVWMSGRWIQVKFVNAREDCKPNPHRRKSFVLFVHKCFITYNVCLCFCSKRGNVAGSVVIVNTIARLCLLLFMSVCAWMFIHVVCAFTCVYWVSNMSPQLPLSPRFHVAFRCLISSSLLTKQSHIRCLTSPQTLPVRLSDTWHRSFSHFHNLFFF